MKKLDIYYYRRRLEQSSIGTLVRVKSKDHPILHTFLAKNFDEIIEGYRELEKEEKKNVLSYSIQKELFNPLLHELKLQNDRTQQEQIVLFKGTRKPMLLLKKV